MLVNKVMREQSIIQQASAGKARFFLQFGGQGNPWLRELARYYSNPAFGRLFATALSALDEEKGRVEGSIALPQGIDLASWLKDADSIPSEDYLSYAAVSLPLIQLTQIAHLENLSISGVTLEQLMASTQSATGHSQGLATAAFACLKYKNDDEYYAMVSQFIKYQLYLGVSAQKTYPYLEPTEAECKQAEALELGGGKPNPMAAVLGSDHESIQ